jgi:hypothetical protein
LPSIAPTLAISSRRFGGPGCRYWRFDRIAWKASPSGLRRVERTDPRPGAAREPPRLHDLVRAVEASVESLGQQRPAEAGEQPEEGPHEHIADGPG